MVSIFGKNRIKLIDDEEEEEERNKGLFPRLSSVLRSTNNRLPPTESNVSAEDEDEDGSMRSLDERIFSNIEDASGEADWLDCQSSSNLSHSFLLQNDILHSKSLFHSTPSSISVTESPLILAENQQQKFQPDSRDKGFLGASNPCRGSILLEETNETVADDIEGSERFDNRTIIGWYFLGEEADDLISPGLSGRRPCLGRPAQSPSPSQGFNLEDEDTVSSPTTTIPKHARSSRRSMVVQENSDSSRSRRSLPSSLRRKSSLKKDEESHRRSLRSSRESAYRPSMGDSPRSHSSRLSRKGKDQPSGHSRKETDLLAERRLTSNSIAEYRQRIKNDDDTTSSRRSRTSGYSKNSDEASAENGGRSTRTRVPNAVQEKKGAVQKQDDSGRRMERSRRGDGCTTPRMDKKNMKVIPAVVEKTKPCQVEIIDNVNAKLEEKEKPKVGSRKTRDHDIRMKQDGSRTPRPSCDTSGLDMSHLTQTFEETVKKQNALFSSKMEPVTCDSLQIPYTSPKRLSKRLSTEVDSRLGDSFSPTRVPKPAATNAFAQRLSTPASRATSKLHSKALSPTDLGPLTFSPRSVERRDRKDASKTNGQKIDSTNVIKYNWEEDSWTSNSKNSFNVADGADDENGFGSPIVHAKMKLGAITPDLDNFFTRHDKEKTLDSSYSTKSVPCPVRLKEPASPDHIRRTSSIRKSSRRARETRSTEPSELRFRSPNRQV